jgi:hypothetical protein
VRTEEEAKKTPKRGDLWKQDRNQADAKSAYILVVESADGDGEFHHAWKYPTDGYFNRSHYTDHAPGYWIDENQYIGNVLTDKDLGWEDIVALALVHLGVSDEAPEPEAEVAPPPAPSPAPAAKPKRTIVETVEDEVGEVKDALETLQIRAEELTRRVGEDLAEVKAALVDVRNSIHTGRREDREHWTKAENDLVNLIHEKVGFLPECFEHLDAVLRREISLSEANLGDLTRVVRKEVIDLLGQVQGEIRAANGRRDEDFAALQNLVWDSEANTQKHIQGARGASAEAAERSMQVERAMFDALTARFNLAMTVCAGTFLAHAALLAFWSFA